MYLKRIEIQGFKTFASRTVFEFRPGITAVVGPNGSGKSNLADAVRWVLGEQSLTNLRCKRSEELIYAGGGRRAPAGLAEVALTIDNSDRLLPLDFDEVTITRRATRSGESDYLINRARVRLRDLLEATAPLGGSYTIINQGLVDAALSLRPEERRRLFEDAAELGGFELRKHEALRRLRETEGNLQRLSDLLAELDPRLRMLKRQAAQARQQRELSAELHQIQLRHYTQQWQEAHSRTAQTRLALADAEALAERARTTQASLGAELQALRSALRARRDELAQLHQVASALHQRAEAAQRDLARADERMAAATRRAEELERQRSELDLRRQQAEALQVEAAAEIRRAEAAYAERRAELAAAEAELAGREQARRVLATELRQAEERALRAAGLVAEQRSRIAQLTSQASQLEREVGELDHATAQALQQVEAARTQVRIAQARSETLEQARTLALAEEQQARLALDELRSARSHADEARATARRTLTDLEARLEALSRLARSYTGVFAGVRAAMQWAERSGRSDFILVQSLIRTPAELETAIEVALGSRLQQIVVEAWADAEAAIAELKRSGAGRATFLPLDSLRSPERMGEPPGQGSPAVLGLAADLVEYDPHYAPVVRQLLGRTLVARDLTGARAELRRLPPGWTIVTPGGEQLQSGGALSGGAPPKESGVLRRERELRELPTQVASARAAVAQAEAHRSELEAQTQRLSSRLRELEAGVREARQQLETARAGYEAAGRRMAQAEQEQAWIGQRRERLSHERAALTGQHNEALADLEAAEVQTRAAASQLSELRTRQEAERQADTAAQAHLAGLRSAAGAAEGQLRAGRSLLAAHEQSLALAVRQEHDAARALANLSDERSNLTTAHQQADALSASLQAEISVLQAQIEPVELALPTEEAHLAGLEASEAEVTAALLAAEAAQGRAALEAQRAIDRQEALFERAAAEGINLAAVEAAVDMEPAGPGELAPTALQPAIEALKTKILRLGEVNPLALEEYEQTAERQRFLSGQIEDLREAGATLVELIAELDEAMQRRFTATFMAVAEEFERSFTRLFGGGSARLMLVGAAQGEAQTTGEGDTPTGGRVQGVEISVRPPGKKQQNIALLSGGERALTAVALLFAILRVNPSPFCILDETDAALDESNVGRFREALAELSTQTQWILITHNRGTIEGADTLYGITMGDDGASKTMSLRVEQYVTVRD